LMKLTHGRVTPYIIDLLSTILIYTKIENLSMSYKSLTDMELIVAYSICFTNYMRI